MLEHLHRLKAVFHEDAARTQQPAQHAKWEWHHEMHARPAAWEWHHEMHARPAAWEWHDDMHATPQALPVNSQQPGAALSLVIVHTAAANPAGQIFTSLVKTEK